MENLKLLFDNGGGLFIKFNDEYAHYYDNMDRAAHDLKEFIYHEDISGWDNNDIENYPNVTYEDFTNGGYKEHDLDNIKKFIVQYALSTDEEKEDFCPGGWINISDFLKAFFI